MTSWFLICLTSFVMKSSVAKKNAQRAKLKAKRSPIILASILRIHLDFQLVT
jgi:hypothetical protein